MDWEEALPGLRGKPAIYHCISRVVDRQFVFGPKEKEQFIRYLRLYEQFCQVRVLTYCVMSNHFHILLEVPAPPPDRGASWSDTELLGHLAVLYSDRQLGRIRWELEHYRAQGNTAAAESLRRRFFARMWDLSSFMKVVKQRFTQWFNKFHGRRGVLWEERFKSVLVESGHAARVVAAYIDLNPVRAGITNDPKDYRWCGYAEAVAGSTRARDGLRLVLFEQLSCVTSEARAAKEVASWREVVRQYRLLLYEDGEDRDPNRTRAEVPEPGRKKRREGIPPEEVARTLARGGHLSEAEMLRCRVRYLADGVAIGREAFLNELFALSRNHFGPRRKGGARKMRRIRSPLRSMRDLQLDAVVPAGG